MSRPDTVLVPGLTEQAAEELTVERSTQVPTGSEWLAQYQALARLLRAGRRLCPLRPVQGMSLWYPRHHIPLEHLRLLELLSRPEPASARQAPACQLSLIRLAQRGLRCLLSAGRDTLLIGWFTLRCGWTLRGLWSEPASVILRTWRYATTPLDGAPDFYFGSLPSQVERRGVRCVLLCGDGRGMMDPRFLTSTLQSRPVRVAPESLLVPVWAPLMTAVQQVAAALAYRRLARRASRTALGTVCAAAALDSLEPATTRNTLLFYSTRAAVRRWRAAVFVTLYEGQPWEQPVWLGARAASTGCRTVGYQHTVIMPHALSVLQRERPAPDYVLCLGERSRQTLLRRGHAQDPARLIPFGSFRWAQGALPAAPRPGRAEVLVVPETGVLREAQLVFHFAMRAAALLPDCRFLFRCHPFRPYDQVRPHLLLAPEAFPNIEISRRESIHEDFARSSILLYRGSSTVLYAVLHGLKPVYVHDDRHPDVDPLCALDCWRERVSSPEEFALLLGRYLSTPSDRLGAEWQRAAADVRAYTAPVSEASVARFLAAVGVSSDRDAPCGA